MEDYDLSVSGHLQVQFDAVAVLDRSIESCKGVLRTGKMVKQPAVRKGTAGKFALQRMFLEGGKDADSTRADSKNSQREKRMQRFFPSFNRIEGG